MGIAEKSLRGHLPKICLGSDISAVIDALSLSFERLREFLRDVLTESNPGTSEDTLSEWYEQFGIRYDSTLSLTMRQARAKQAHTSVGGQSIGYLNEQLQIAYPDVELQEVYIDATLITGSGMAGRMMATDYPSWLPSPPVDGTYPNFYYRVYGEVEFSTDLYGIQSLLSHIMPVPYEPVYAVTIRNLTPTAMAGIGMTGLMMAGREE